MGKNFTKQDYISFATEFARGKNGSNIVTWESIARESVTCPEPDIPKEMKKLADKIKREVYKLIISSEIDEELFNDIEKKALFNTKFRKGNYSSVRNCFISLRKRRNEKLNTMDSKQDINSIDNNDDYGIKTIQEEIKRIKYELENFDEIYEIDDFSLKNELENRLKSLEFKFRNNYCSMTKV